MLISTTKDIIKYILFGYFQIFSILILNIELFLMDIIKMERKKEKTKENAQDNGNRHKQKVLFSTISKEVKV